MPAPSPKQIYHPNNDKTTESAILYSESNDKNKNRDKLVESLALLTQASAKYEYNPRIERAIVAIKINLRALDNSSLKETQPKPPARPRPSTPPSINTAAVTPKPPSRPRIPPAPQKPVQAPRADKAAEPNPKADSNYVKAHQNVIKNENNRNASMNQKGPMTDLIADAKDIWTEKHSEAEMRLTTKEEINNEKVLNKLVHDLDSLHTRSQSRNSNVSYDDLIKAHQDAINSLVPPGSRRSLGNPLIAQLQDDINVIKEEKQNAQKELSNLQISSYRKF